MVDSGLIVVVSIILSMVVCVFVVLTYVKYEWCDVLFSNFTVSQFSNYANSSLLILTSALSYGYRQLSVTCYPDKIPE